MKENPNTHILICQLIEPPASVIFYCITEYLNN